MPSRSALDLGARTAMQLGRNAHSEGINDPEQLLRYYVDRDGDREHLQHYTAGYREAAAKAQMNRAAEHAAVSLIDTHKYKPLPAHLRERFRSISGWIPYGEPS